MPIKSPSKFDGEARRKNPGVGSRNGFDAPNARFPATSGDSTQRRGFPGGFLVGAH